MSPNSIFIIGSLFFAVLVVRWTINYRRKDRAAATAKAMASGQYYAWPRHRIKLRKA